MRSAAGRSSRSPTSISTTTGFLTTVQVTFAADIGAGVGANLNAAANSAIAAAYALAGGGANQVAVQFTFGGRTYLAINQDGVLNAFRIPATCCSTSPARPARSAPANFITGA